MIKYLYTYPPETPGDDKHIINVRNPVIPWYLNNTSPMSFLDTTTLELFERAIVMTRELNLDTLSLILKKEYPGIPDNIHDSYVLNTAMAAHLFNDNTIVQLVLKDSNIVIIDVHNPRNYTTFVVETKQ